METKLTADALARALDVPIADIDRLAARNVFKADAAGQFPLKSSIMAYIRHWERLDANVRWALASANEHTLVSAEQLSETLGLTMDEIWALVAVGALHCGEARMFRLTNTLADFMDILGETVLSRSGEG